jgi:hypothetical protein
MKIFRLSPGPRIGQIIEAVREARAAGEVQNKQQAIEYIKNWLDKEIRHRLE